MNVYLKTLAMAVFVSVVGLAPVRAEDNKVYELRIYTTNAGKLDALLARFRDHTCKLFEKHGMENIGYWTPTDKEQGSENTLIYVIAHKDREAAKASWGKFVTDPEWQSVSKKSEENGKILAKAPVSVFMKATDFSPAIKPAAGAGARVFQLRDYPTPEGRLADLFTRFRDSEMALFSKHGMTHVGYFTPLDDKDGAGKRMIYILAFPSKEAGDAAFKAFRDDPDWIKVKEASEKKAGGPLTIQGPNGIKTTYMKPTDCSPIK